MASFHCTFKLLIILFIVPVFPAKTAQFAPVIYDSAIENEMQDLTKYLQPNDILSGKYDFTDPTEHQCARNCDFYPESRLCYYKFTLEQYHVMGPACDGCPQDINACYNMHCVPADGLERPALTANRCLCSLAIMTCQGDQIVVDIINKIAAQQTSIHWHGLHMYGTSYFDGATYLTQCPIVEGQTFRYSFQASQFGDFLWHSHEFAQMYDGLQGPIIVRCSQQLEPYSNLYQFDLYSHTMFIAEWGHTPFSNKVPGYNKVVTETGILPDTFLFNGHGSYVMNNGIETRTPLAEFKVIHGATYRFRVISSSNAPLIFTIEGHEFTVISIDAGPVRPIKVGSLFISAGERYSIVIEANQEPGTYWIQVQGVTKNVRQYAILRYINEDGSYINTSPDPSNIQIPLLPLALNLPILNDVRDSCNPANTTAICVDQMESLTPASNLVLKPEPDYRIIMRSDVHRFTNEELFVEGQYQNFRLPFTGGPSIGGHIYSDMYNNISSSLPPFPMLTQSNAIPMDLVCTEECLAYNIYCRCMLVYKVPLDSVVELIIIDDQTGSPSYHSFHLHGYSFRIIKMGGRKEIEENPEGFYKNVITPYYPLYPTKDTVTIPALGYAILRFQASNPGLWFAHCHVYTHNFYGMKAIIQVGERYEFDVPPNGFPTCGNFIPEVKWP